MTVRKLIEALSAMNPDATVLLMTQKSWPIENDLIRVAERQDIGPDEGEDENDPELHGNPDDVFLVEGRQLRYGKKAAWFGASDR